MRRRRRSDLLEWIEGAGVHLSGLRAHDRRALVGVQCGAERVGLHSALRVGRDGFRRAQSEQAQRPVDCDVPFLADEDPDPRRARQPVSSHVPSCALEDPEPRSGERGDASHLRTGDEADRRIRGQAEEIADPVADDLFDHRGRGAPDVQAGVLIPCGREPVRGERSREGTTDDKAEVAAAAHRHESRVGGGRETLDDLARVGRTVREGAAERAAQLVGTDLREDRPVLQRLQVLGGELGRAAKQRTDVVHPADSTRRMTCSASRLAISSPV